VLKIFQRKWIGELKMLSVLNLLACSIWMVPLDLRRLELLEELFLRENKLPRPLNRNVVMRKSISDFLDVVAVYETVLLLFMIWKQQREQWSEHCLGSLPRDVLFYMCGFLGEVQKRARPKTSIQTNKRALLIHQ
jgi:hypothetical protein